MKLITSITSIALILLSLFSITVATPLPTREASTITEALTRAINAPQSADVLYEDRAVEARDAILERDGQSDCTNSGGHWSAGAGWCVCAGDAIVQNSNKCPPGQGWNGQVGWGVLNGSGKNSAGALGLLIAGAAAMAML